MAPQGTMIVPIPAVESPTFSLSPHANSNSKPFVPVALLIFLGLCFAYTFSYVLYRIVMSRRRESEDTPDSPDRGVSQFMNGVRLTLNFGHSRRLPSSPPKESPNTLQEEKPLTDPSFPSPTDIPGASPLESSSLPLIIVMPPFTLQSNQEISDAQPPEQAPTTTDEQASVPAPAQAPDPPTQPRFSQLVAAKVKFLSRDRAEAIAQDPKLAPVQGPLRPLSMDSSPPSKRRTSLFGLGLMLPRGHHAGEPDADSGSGS